MAVAALVASSIGSPRAETLEGSLGRAYRANPELNATRAGLRATDEEVALARAGYRPTVAADADIGVQNVQGAAGGERLARTSFPRGVGLTVEQTLFNGFQTDSDTRRAQSNVLGQREGNYPRGGSVGGGTPAAAPLAGTSLPLARVGFR